MKKGAFKALNLCLVWAVHCTARQNFTVEELTEDKCIIGGRRTMRGTPGREPHMPYQISKFLTKYGIVCPFKRNMLTSEGQHFICPLNMGYIPYQRVILDFRGMFLPKKRVLQDMICCPSAVNKCPFKRTYYSIFGKECFVFGNIICCPFRM